MPRNQPPGKPIWETHVPETFAEKIGAAIQIRRTQLGLTQKQVAAQCLTTGKYLAKVERAIARRGNLFFLETVASALQIDPFELLAHAATLGDQPTDESVKLVFPPRFKAYDVDQMKSLVNTLAAVSRMLSKMVKHANARIYEYEKYDMAPKHGRIGQRPHRAHARAVVPAADKRGAAR